MLATLLRATAPCLVACRHVEAALDWSYLEKDTEKGLDSYFVPITARQSRSRGNVSKGRVSTGVYTAV